MITRRICAVPFASARCLQNIEQRWHPTREFRVVGMPLGAV